MNGNTIAAKLQAISDGISGVRGNTEIQEKMEKYGYTSERLGEGEALFTEAKHMLAVNKEGYSDQYVAVSEKSDMKLPAYKAYIITLKVTRVAFKKNPEMLTRFNAAGRRSRSLTGWLNDADIFYTNLLKNPDVLATLTRFGVTMERLQEEQMQVENVKQQYKKQLGTKGVAQQSTVDRDKAIDDACDWYSDFRAIARVALYDRPQLLEALGIVKK